MPAKPRALRQDGILMALLVVFFVALAALMGTGSVCTLWGLGNADSGGFCFQLAGVLVVAASGAAYVALGVGERRASSSQASHRLLQPRLDVHVTRQNRNDTWIDACTRVAGESFLAGCLFHGFSFGAAFLLDYGPYPASTRRLLCAFVVVVSVGIADLLWRYSIVPAAKRDEARVASR